MRFTKRDFSTVTLLSLALVFFSSVAFAHHSRAVYDLTSVITLKGTVKELQWTNPHTFLILIVPDAKGNPIEWKLEGGAPSFLVRNGWKRDTLKAGDKVTIRAFPMRDGSRGGSFAEVEMPDGTVYRGPDKIGGQRKRAETDPI